MSRKNRRKIFLPLLLSFVASSSSAIKLEGTWVEEKSLVLTGTETAKKFIESCLTPKMVFDDGFIAVWQPEEQCEVNGRKIKASSYFFTFTYEVVAEAEGTVVTKNLSENTKEESIGVYHFIDENTFWIYYYGRDNKGTYHQRHYYKKVTDTEVINEYMKEFERVGKIAKKYKNINAI